MELKPKPFKVVIVGGSVAGLTLAHCLSRAGIDYVVLEKRGEIAPQVGASIGIMPHGARILDQLGLFDSVEQLIEPLHTAHILYPDGFEHTNRSPELLEKRFGIPLAFLERQKLLQVLYDFLPNQSKVLSNKAVVSVSHEKDTLCAVRTQDGGVYEGDLVVGADGVHSQVRSHMWNSHSGRISKKEESALTTEYACVFGISESVSGLRAGEQITSLNDGHSFLVFPGKNNRIFWFLLWKLDKVYKYPHAPRFSTSDAEELCRKHSDDRIWKDVRFGDIWQKREVFSMTGLEEHVFETWHSDRVVCIGDSMHKMAPNTGQGANCAIEDAAVLANLLHDALKTEQVGSRLSDQKMRAILQTLNATRLYRVREIYKGARFVVRLHARHSLFLRLLGRYYVPRSGDLPANTASKVIAGSADLKFLPPSQRLGPGWEKFQAKRPVLIVFLGSLIVVSLVLCSLTWQWKGVLSRWLFRM
nr:FAD-dependent monooxygenase BrvE [Penicillium bialowiezense]